MSDTRERLKKNTRKRKLPRLLIRLERKVESLSELLRSESLEFPSAQSNYSKDFYQRLPLGLQRRILRDVEFYIDVLKHFRASGGSLWDSRRLTWAYLKSSGLQPCSASFSKFNDDDVIEIYNSEYMQTFRNMRFFQNFRGCLFDLVVLDWMTLFKRASEIEEQLFIQLDSCFRRLPRIQEFLNIPEHEVSLRFHPDEPSFKSHLKYRSGLINRMRKTKRVEAVLVISESELLQNSDSQKWSKAI